MADKYPSVFNLQLHEKNGQQLIYEEGEEMEALVHAHTSHTTLTSYFETVSKEIDNLLTQEQLGTDTVTGHVYPAAPELTYLDFPTFYILHLELQREKMVTQKKTKNNLIVLAAFILRIQVQGSNFIFECYCARYVEHLHLSHYEH